MDIRRGMFIVILLAFASQSDVFADKIYLKSGKMLEGKVIDKRESYNPARSYCEDFNDIVVWDNGTYRCVPKDGILRIEKEFKKPEGLALLAKDDKWGKPDNGYVTQLIPQIEKYIVGKPMKFGLVLKNVGESVRWYDHQGISHNVLRIKTGDNNEPYYKVGPFQTGGAEHPIDKGEVVTLFEGRNITDEYVIIKPGKYTIQFRGGDYGMAIDSTFPASNVIEFEVKPGTADECDLLISSLVGILPDVRWQAATAPKGDRRTPAGRKEVKGISIILVRHSGLIRDTIITTLWQTKTAAEVIGQGAGTETSDFLGRNASGNLYAKIPPKALDYWPKMKEDIVKALKLKIPVR
jgi:hypothetical protein